MAGLCILSYIYVFGTRTWIKSSNETKNASQFYLIGFIMLDRVACNNFDFILFSWNDFRLTFAMKSHCFRNWSHTAKRQFLMYEHLVANQLPSHILEGSRSNWPATIIGVDTYQSITWNQEQFLFSVSRWNSQCASHTSFIEMLVCFW